ncbi:sulfatase [Arenibacter echinorum]|uniref:Putative sulfatase n=1 Tax=Arenibacter echinorum TaxID=440515 RepID=A0A327R2P2_9FLAO|nr:sulfatase [Arenibacter echinorum]RAJ10232.1 putative sulfatase [Arenibacter echinorum]
MKSLKLKKSNKCFLGRYFVIYITFLAGCFTILEAQEVKKLNVLFIASDDLNNDMEVFDSPFIQTPNLNRLLNRGVRFDRAYNQYPWCSPSRASVLTGRRPDQTKVTDLKTEFRKHLPDAVTLPQLFKNNGYFSARVGKIFHYGVPNDIGTDGQDDPVSWNYRVNPIGIDKTEEHNIINYTPDRGLGSALSYWMANGSDDDQTDGKVANEAVKIIKKHKDDPFFLAVGFFRPHTPYVAPKKYFDLYPLDKIRLPEERDDDWDNKPEAAKWNAKMHFGLSVQQRKEVLRAYYASISFMDAQVGKLLDALDETGLSENTIIVFWSDHGYNVGQHGQWMKQSLFEHAARTPLIISSPGMQQDRITESIVELLDIYPTIADLAGIPVSSDIEGKSLRKILEEPSLDWDTCAYTQVFRRPSAMSSSEVTETIDGRSVRYRQWRYTEWNGGDAGMELYDYDNDPNEFQNLVHKPEYKSIRNLMAVLLHKNQAKVSE